MVEKQVVTQKPVVASIAMEEQLQDGEEGSATIGGKVKVV